MPSHLILFSLRPMLKWLCFAPLAAVNLPPSYSPFASAQISRPLSSRVTARRDRLPNPNPGNIFPRGTIRSGLGLVVVVVAIDIVVIVVVRYDISRSENVKMATVVTRSQHAIFPALRQR